MEFVHESVDYGGQENAYGNQENNSGKQGVKRSKECARGGVELVYRTHAA